MEIQKDKRRLIILKNNNTERFTVPISNFIRKQNELKWCDVGRRIEKGQNPQNKNSQDRHSYMWSPNL